MTVPSTQSRNDYTGTGAVDTYSYNFRILDDTHLKVTIADPNGVEYLLTLTTHYTVTGVGSYSGGSITFTGGNLANGWDLTIRRVVPELQQTDLRNQGGYYPETVEDTVDYLTYIAQQTADESARTIKQPETEAGTNLTIPKQAERASLFLGFDTNGDPIAATPAGVPATAFAATLLDDANAAEARTTLDVPSNSEAAILTLENTFTNDNHFGGSVNFKFGVDIASAAQLNVQGSGNYFDVTGVVTITSFTSKNGAGSWVVLHFDAALTLTHHATNLILPGGANIVTAAGDIAHFYEYATGDWRCISYTPAASPPGGGGSFRGALVYGSAGTQTIATNTEDYIHFDQEQYDTDSIHNNVTNNDLLFVPTGVSKIRLSAQCTFVGQTGGSRIELYFVRVTTSGWVGTPTRQEWTPFSTASEHHYHLNSAVIDTSDSVYWRLAVWHDAGVNRTVVHSAAKTWMAMEIIE